MFYVNRDYVENFIKIHKKAIFKAVSAFILFAAAFFVFCIRGYDSKENDFELINMDKPQNKIEVYSGDENNPQTGNEYIGDENKDIKDKIYVDISGAVNKPYVYELENGTRLYQAIEKAGGLHKNADTSNLNLAQILTDQDKIVVFTVDELLESTQKGNDIDNKNISSTKEFGMTSSNKTRININTATEDELQNLNGVGQSTANKIISYRQQHGSFKKIEDLMNVSGIGQKTFEKYKDKITI